MDHSVQVYMFFKPLDGMVDREMNSLKMKSVFVA